MINSEEVIKHIGTVIAGLEGIKSALNGEETNKQQKVEIDSKVLADKLANTYTTLHPNYRIDSQIRNIQDMANNPDKVGILVNWLNKTPEGIEEFFKLPKDKKQEVLKTVISTQEPIIREILTKRFSS